jgi:hypothetical protein
MKLLTQNSDLKRGGIYGWTLPAHWVQLSDGSKFNCCPQAGICAAFCYAKSGAFLWKSVRAAHVAKLEMTLHHLDEWQELMNQELLQKKYVGKYIRIHDSGDFFSIEYARAWLSIAARNRHCTFYAYTKEVAMFKVTLKDELPDNFILIYSFGGKQDNLIDVNTDRHSDVFTDYDAMIAAGYNDIGSDDKQAAIHPNFRVGLYRNNIKHFIKKQGNKTFSEWQRK